MTITTIKNLTWHLVNVINSTGDSIKIFPAEDFGRMNIPQKYHTIGSFNWIPVFKVEHNLYDNLLPPKEDGVIYIVSTVVAQVSKRDDFYIVGQRLKGFDGKVLWCEGIVKNPYI